MRRKITTFEMMNEVMCYISRDKSSFIVPFKGNFPILKFWQEELYQKECFKHEFYEDLPDWIKDVMNKAEQVKIIDEGFRRYLRDNKIFDDFFTMTDEQKAAELERFMNANSIDVGHLIIK